jgi:hypothetical protein
MGKVRLGKKSFSKEQRETLRALEEQIKILTLRIKALQRDMGLPRIFVPEAELMNEELPYGIEIITSENAVTLFRKIIK